jgi:lipoate-protein ligase A
LKKAIALPMQRLPQLRVIIESAPNSGDWNMAADESLLETAIASDLATLRWYAWREPTVSLGYFQKSADLDDDAKLCQLPAVRRLSGGGAIIHDDELTYSLAIPASQRLFDQPHELYDIVHQAVCQGLYEIGFAVQCRGTTLKRRDEPLLCFQRQDAHDVTLHGYKVLGSAQRRRRGAILQHGSLIRRASSWANHVPGLADLQPVSLPENLPGRLATHVAERIADLWSIESFSESEIAVTRSLCEQRSVNMR